MIDLLKFLDLAKKHGHDNLSQDCEVCTRIKDGIFEIQSGLRIREKMKKRMMDLYDQISRLKIQEGILTTNGTEPISVQISIAEASNELKELELYWTKEDAILG